MNDRQKITDLIAKYADAVNSRDIEAWSAVWSEDGIYTLNGELRKTGREAIVSLYAKSLNKVEAMIQLVHNGTVELEGNSATGRWYISEQQILDKETNFFVIGIYQDRYIRTAQGWKFAERHLDILYRENRVNELRSSVFPYPARII